MPEYIVEAMLGLTLVPNLLAEKFRYFGFHFFYRKHGFPFIGLHRFKNIAFSDPLDGRRLGDYFVVLHRERRRLLTCLIHQQTMPISNVFRA